MVDSWKEKTGAILLLYPGMEAEQLLQNDFRKK